MNDKTYLTPYKELRSGSDSIYDHITPKYSVPVIEYLKNADIYAMSPGIYPHPFKPEKNLLGPYWLTDGKYCWDRDMWKYVVKYNLTVPKEFVEYVMAQSEKQPTKLPTQQIKKITKGTISFLPDDMGDVKLEDF